MKMPLGLCMSSQTKRLEDFILERKVSIVSERQKSPQEKKQRQRQGKRLNAL